MAVALFYLFGAIAIACALGMVFAGNPVYSAVYLIGTLLAIAGEFLLLGAPLLAALQVLVYAGAIMVLYLFVIMLLNLGREQGFRWWTNWRTYAAVVLVGLVSYTALARISLEVPFFEKGFTSAQVKDVARRMFADPPLLLLVEALSVLLLIAVVGAIYLGRRFSPEEEAAAAREALPETGQMPEGNP